MAYYSQDTWTSDPFQLAERAGRFVARGAADMKGWVALAINRVAAMHDDDLAAPLCLLLTADEEIGSIGAQRFAERVRGDTSREFPLPGSCLVGEPTEMRVVRMHKGHAKARITAIGKPAHSGYPHLGVNAIEIAGRALQILTALAESLRQERCASSTFFPECPHPVLNVATIAGGSAVNIVPERCELQFGLRLLPGQRSSDYLDRVRQMLTEMKIDSRAKLIFEVVNDSPPMLCEETAEIYSNLCELFGQCATPSVSYASDAGWLSTLGLDCVLCGPGSIEVAHRANESIDIAEWRAGGVALDRAIQRMCCGG